MADSTKAALKTISKEGGLTSDTGGLTNFGISSRSYPNENIRGMTKERAAALYVRDYWNPLLLNGIKSQEIAESIFDFAVNSGISRAVKTARIILSSPKTGAMTSEEIKQINLLDPKAFNYNYGKQRESFYTNLTILDPVKYQKYLKGWINRARSFYTNIDVRQLVFIALPVATILLMSKRKRG